MLNRLFIGEKMFQRDYRSRMFRTAYRTKNDPDKIFIGENNVPDRLFIGATNTANGKLHTKLVQLYFPPGLPLAVQRTQTKDSARATVTRTFVTCCNPKSCPEQ